MNQVLESLKTRRSIRSFKADQVPEELLNQVLEAGTYAPTGMGTQNPIIIAITSPEMRKKVAEANAAVMGRPGTDPFYGAPVVLMVITKNTPIGVCDGSCVMDNLLNAAWAVGLGSCWIHRAAEEMEGDFGRGLKEKLGLEGDYIGVGHVALGYIAGEIPQPKPRKDHWVYRV